MKLLTETCMLPGLVNGSPYLCVTVFWGTRAEVGTCTRMCRLQLVTIWGMFTGMHVCVCVVGSLGGVSRRRMVHLYVWLVTRWDVALSTDQMANVSYSLHTTPSRLVFFALHTSSSGVPMLMSRHWECDSRFVQNQLVDLWVVVEISLDWFLIFSQGLVG